MSSSKKINIPPIESKPSKQPTKTAKKLPARGVSKEESLSNLAAILAVTSCDKEKKRIKSIMSAIENKK